MFLVLEEAKGREGRVSHIRYCSGATPDYAQVSLLAVLRGMEGKRDLTSIDMHVKHLTNCFGFFCSDPFFCRLLLGKSREKWNKWTKGKRNPNFHELLPRTPSCGGFLLGFLKWVSILKRGVPGQSTGYVWT